MFGDVGDIWVGLEFGLDVWVFLIVVVWFWCWWWVGDDGLGMCGGMYFVFLYVVGGCNWLCLLVGWSVGMFDGIGFVVCGICDDIVFVSCVGLVCVFGSGNFGCWFGFVWCDVGYYVVCWLILVDLGDCVLCFGYGIVFCMCV